MFLADPFGIRLSAETQSRSQRDAFPWEPEAGAAVHLAFEHLDPVDVSFDDGRLHAGRSAGQNSIPAWVILAFSYA
ncbi:hypothetical protein GCM10010276_86880 [Streptomyces longisporus]|uniref:Uncharacterized protein n=1 Tax=Streptomyces longisporus TaxID=1948 RepID=A0ABP6ATK8_STRLO